MKKIKLGDLRNESFEYAKKREVELLDTRKETVAIYQLNEKHEDILFVSSNDLNKKGKYPDYKNYNIVYLFEVKGDNSKLTDLEEIYYTFNERRPEDYFGHSLSISDVVVITNKNGIRAYYVDSIGFKETESFVKGLLCEYDPYIIKISYSWGDEESDIFCPSKEEAIREAKENLLKEVEISASEHPESEIGVHIDDNNMYIHYNYDDTYCYYNIVKY